MKECRCPVCNSRLFDVDCGRVEIKMSSEDNGEGQVRVFKLCKCKSRLVLTFSSTHTQYMVSM